jgi:hypothetical protein
MSAHPAGLEQLPIDQDCCGSRQPEDEQEDGQFLTDRIAALATPIHMFAAAIKNQTARKAISAIRMP